MPQKKTRKWIFMTVCIVVFVGSSYALYASNLFLKEGTVSFSRKSRHMNNMKLRMPFGYYVYEYYLIPSNGTKGVFQVGGGSLGWESQLFGSMVGSSNMYPRAGTFQIPPNTHTQVSKALYKVAMVAMPKTQRIKRRCGMYIYFTKKKYSDKAFAAMVASWTLTTGPWAQKKNKTE